MDNLSPQQPLCTVIHVDEFSPVVPFCQDVSGKEQLVTGTIL